MINVSVPRAGLRPRRRGRPHGRRRGRAARCRAGGRGLLGRQRDGPEVARGVDGRHLRPATRRSALSSGAHWGGVFDKAKGAGQKNRNMCDNTRQDLSSCRRFKGCLGLVPSLTVLCSSFEAQLPAKSRQT